jgi:cell division initiation protein
MRMTPLDIHNHRFPSRWKGYDPEDVDAFLKLIAEDYESLLMEAESNRERVRHLEARVTQLSANEEALQETLVTAQTVTQELKHTAVKESEVLVGQAEVRAEKILDAAHRRVAKLAQDLREMKAMRSRLAGSIRSAIDTHLALLDELADPQDDEALALEEGKLAYLPRTRKVESDGA